MQEAQADLFGALAHDDTAPLVILQRAVGVSHHLQHVVDGVIHVPKDRWGEEAKPQQQTLRRLTP